MTQPNLALFQACATAIPTMLIAVAVSIGRGKTLAEDYDEVGRYERIFRLVSVLIMGALIANAEMKALLAISRGEGSREQAFWVVLGAMVLLVNVIYELIYPLIDSEKEEWIKLTVKGVILALPLAVLYYVGREFVPFK